ncbi:MAG: glycerol-3-phosphate dehydrogenase [Sandaracinaceae bacterium]|nr:glycerol-3-phosphate dehydrogenase [Sandaracinaceae bacterium]
MPTRQAMWDKLGSKVDLLVVGGGITGAGIARDASRRGLSVALVEMNDLAFGTSSRSSKLIHGGLRYLEQYEFSLVFESVSERRVLQDIAPHLVNPLGFLFPVYQGARKPVWMINAGMWIYDGLSLFRSPKIHKNLKPREVAEHEPALRSDGLKGAPLYYDCATDDARLTLETALDAVAHGATIATWAKVTSFLKTEDGRVRGAVVRDELTGALKEIEARTVVNATGPWTDQTMAMSQPRSGSSVLRPTKGIHIVVDHQKLPVNHAVVCFHPSDARVLFAIPWGDRSYVGTTDTDYEGDPSAVCATLADVDYLIAASNHYFPQHTLQREDVIATWAGIRPLMAPNGEGTDEMSESSVSREHQILIGPDRLITIAGGKLTTYRRMAGEVVDTVARLLELSGKPRELGDPRTGKEPLPGAVGWPEDDDHAKVADEIAKAGHPRVPEDVATYLADRYGMRGVDIGRRCTKTGAVERLVPGRPEIMAAVDWAVTEELAATICDVMIRRTQIFFRDHDQGLGAVEKVADRMAELLGWDAQTRAAEIARYRDEVALSRKWKEELQTSSEPAHASA